METQKSMAVSALHKTGLKKTRTLPDNPEEKY
jgi:hypothetical protein